MKKLHDYSNNGSAASRKREKVGKGTRKDANASSATGHDSNSLVIVNSGSRDTTPGAEYH